MKKAILLQQASGEHVALLDLIRSHHARYAERHRMEYRCVYGLQQAERAPVWDKILLILNALREEPPVEWLFWVDSDAIIMDFNRDLREALCDHGELGMVIHPNPYHFNAGALYMRNTPRLIGYFEKVWAKWPINHGWEEQESMNRVLLDEWFDGFQPLPAAWNSTYGVNEADRPVVRAWHGLNPIEKRIRLMRETLQAVENPEWTSDAVRE